MLAKLFGRKRGISLLVPTQNSEKTVELCIRSFAEFPDEMIVVDNGSTDRTKEIIRKLEPEFDHMRFYDAPTLKDLYENRQYAFERSQFDWVVRIDSDYVAYTDGPNNIRHLRSWILKQKVKLRPLAIGIHQINLVHDFSHTGPLIEDRDPESAYHIDPPRNDLPARILQWYPSMRFQRNGRWEGVRFQKYLRKHQLNEAFWFHCSFKTKRDYLFRFERTNWRELGDFARFPALADYVATRIRDRFRTDDVEEAAELHFAECIKPHLRPFDESQHGAYPALIRERIHACKA